MKNFKTIDIWYSFNVEFRNDIVTLFQIYKWYKLVMAVKKVKQVFTQHFWDLWRIFTSSYFIMGVYLMQKVMLIFELNYIGTSVLKIFYSVWKVHFIWNKENLQGFYAVIFRIFCWYLFSLISKLLECLIKQRFLTNFENTMSKARSNLFLMVRYLCMRAL